MKNYKQILEAINRGIQLALDDYEGQQNQHIAPIKNTIKRNDSIKWVIDNFVDLQLPSGTLWAKCNIGANSPEEYGNYYAWGELMPKEYYDWEHYKFGTEDNLTKYNEKNCLTKLLPEDDIAYQTDNIMKMPTKEQLEELIKLPNKQTSINGVKGRVFAKTKKELKGKFNDKTMLFIPTSGRKYLDQSFYVGFDCRLWSSSLHADNPSYAWYLYFNSDDIGMYSSSRYNGFTVRPVMN